jgi:hypothetical protein
MIMSKPFVVASLLAGLLVIAGAPANAKLGVGSDAVLDQLVGEHKTTSPFDRLSESAPHSVFDQIGESAPRAPFDGIGNDAP